MPDDDPTTESAAQGQPATKIPVSTAQPAQKVIASPDRAELLTHARAFLTSPQARLQDTDVKRTFLTEKGFTPSEIDQLLRELPPSVPPRTYPPLSPSNLPNLLAGVIRLFSWFTGTSAIVLLVYYRHLLPRLAQSYQARIALRRHHFTFIARFTESVSAFKATQAEIYKDMPRTVPVYEDSQYAQCHTIDDLLSYMGSSLKEPTQPGADIPDTTILRCVLEELSCPNTQGIPAEELFRHLENKLPWLGREDGAARQSDLWNQLNTCPLFASSMPEPSPSNPLPLDHPSRLLWKYVPPPRPTTPPLLVSLAKLQAALPRSQGAVPTSPHDPPLAQTVSASQRTLQVLSDLTGYITTQIYTVGLPSIRSTSGIASGGNLVEDEFRREIRALKGLMLNRRTFLPFGAGTSGSTSDPPQSS